MTKSITTLVEDVYALFGSGHHPAQVNVDVLGQRLATHITRALQKREHGDGLRASNVGTECDRRSWYLENKQDAAENIEPHTQLKFLYGHLIEELVLFLAHEAGHSITQEQKTVTVEGVHGHLDAVIDGVVVDVKSANSRGMEKFKKHRLESEDPFGYLPQLDFYLEGMKDDPEVTVKGSHAFLAVDKELGHIVLDVYRRPPETGTKTKERIKHKQQVIQSSVPPVRPYMPDPDGRSGNLCIGLKCKYCEFKTLCHDDTNGGQGLRKFIYSSGPRWLTHVEREPDVPEIKG